MVYIDELLYQGVFDFSPRIPLGTFSILLSVDEFNKEKELTTTADNIKTNINNKSPGLCRQAVPCKSETDDPFILLMIEDEAKPLGCTEAPLCMQERYKTVSLKAYNFITTPDDNTGDAKLTDIAGTVIEIQKVIDYYTPELFCCHSNLQAVRVGVKNVEGEFVRAVALECQHKGCVPFGEETFPQTLGGYPVRVYESYIDDGNGASGNLTLESQGEKIVADINRPDIYGSVGPLMQSKTFLSAAHVVCRKDVLMHHIKTKKGGQVLNIDPKCRKIYHIDEKEKSHHVGDVSKAWYGGIRIDDREYGVDLVSVEIRKDQSISWQSKQESRRTGYCFLSNLKNMQIVFTSNLYHTFVHLSTKLA